MSRKCLRAAAWCLGQAVVQMYFHETGDMCATSTGGPRFWPGWRSCLESSSRVPAFLQLHMDFDGSSSERVVIAKSTGQPSPICICTAAEDRDVSSGPSRERPTTRAARQSLAAEILNARPFHFDLPRPDDRASRDMKRGDVT
jgi:hypothetical protein